MSFQCLLRRHFANTPIIDNIDTLLSPEPEYNIDNDNEELSVNLEEDDEPIFKRKPSPRTLQKGIFIRFDPLDISRLVGDSYIEDLFTDENIKERDILQKELAYKLRTNDWNILIKKLVRFVSYKQQRNPKIIPTKYQETRRRSNWVMADLLRPKMRANEILSKRLK